MTKHRYHLQKYTTNAASRFRCPQCGDKHSLALYVDSASGQPVDERCGRCNHESGCGYHLTPSQFFAENPNARGELIPVRRVTPSPPKPLCTIAREYVGKSFDRDLTSPFAVWLTRYFGTDAVFETFTKYLVGRTSSGWTAFWQIDTSNRVRAGKFLLYGADGHRVKNGDPRLNGRVDVDWAHAHMKRDGRLPNDWELTQCLFGEHLLAIPAYGKMPVAVVEAEKTAVICAIRYPQFVWLACGGIGQFSDAKMQPLKGRTVTLFPDRDGYDKWKIVAQMLSKYCRISLSDVLMADDDPAHAKWDLADVISDEIDHPESEAEANFRKLAEINPAILDLKAAFDCQIVNNPKQ